MKQPRPGFSGARFRPPEAGFCGCQSSQKPTRRITLKVQRDGRSFTVDVTADGEGLVSHAGSALLAGVADKTGLTTALSAGLAGTRRRRGGHDPGRVIRDLAVMLADGGEALCDLRAVRDQSPLFGEVASDSTAYRAIEKIAVKPDLLESLRGAHAKARARAWSLGLAPGRLTIDLDATLIGAHSEKEGAAGTFKGGFGFHPMLAYFDETSEAAAAMLRPGNAGANTAADQVAVAEAAIEQIPADRIEGIEILLRVDSAGASHELLDWAREGRIGFSVGYELRESLREAIEALPERAWKAAHDTDGQPRANGEVAEATESLDLSVWPEGSRVIVRRERAGRGPDSPRQGHRPGEAALPRVRPQRRLVGADRDRPRPARLDAGAAAERRAGPLRAQAAALPALARRRAPGLLGPPRQAASAGRLAMGR